jgi:hypothetical protein
MKKYKFLALLSLASAFIFSCGSNDDEDPINPCNVAISAAIVASQDYANNNTEATCNTYRNALTAQIAACGDASGDLQSLIDGLNDCIVNTLQGSINVTVGTLAKNFRENITVDLVGTTLTVRAEDSASSDWISFDVTEGNTGTDIISNFTIHLISSDYTPTSNASGTFTSSLTVNSNTMIRGTFSGPVISSSNAVVGLTSGIININR